MQRDGQAVMGRLEWRLLMLALWLSGLLLGLVLGAWLAIDNRAVRNTIEVEKACYGACMEVLEV